MRFLGKTLWSNQNNHVDHLITLGETRRRGPEIWLSIKRKHEVDRSVGVGRGGRERDRRLSLTLMASTLVEQKIPCVSLSVLTSQQQIRFVPYDMVTHAPHLHRACESSRVVYFELTPSDGVSCIALAIYSYHRHTTPLLHPSSPLCLTFTFVSAFLRNVQKYVQPRGGG